MTSPSTSPLSEYVAAFAPTTAPFFSHWNSVLLPALVGVAVKVTFVPGQIWLVVLATIVNDGITEAGSFTMTMKSSAWPYCKDEHGSGAATSAASDIILMRNEGHVTTPAEATVKVEVCV